MLMRIYIRLDISVNAYIIEVWVAAKSSTMVPLFAALADPTRLRLLNLMRAARFASAI